MKVLVLDIGGTHVKMSATGRKVIRKVTSGSDYTPDQLAKDVLEGTKDWKFEAVSIGFPAPVHHGVLVREPHNLAPGWVGFDFARALEHPVKLLNDAAMQALGSYEGGRMLFLGLGTGLGSALVFDNVVAPLEFAHLPYKKDSTFEDYVGLRGLEDLGKKKWREAVADVVNRLRDAVVADYVVLGGGNAKKLKELPPHTRLGNNTNAIKGGLRLWDADVKH